ncbi:MAG: ribonuclease D, partial [Alphaproteobacteria bacterium]|nr:ribonuclease D [Alphaproteobacteria bacterium]
MEMITTTEALAAFCARAMAAPYVTIDTEFLRERTYWSKLCLVQLALPAEDGTTDGPAAIVDPIAGEGMSLAPLYALLAHPGTVKVFHAARQDIEIFFVEGGVMPAPLFDTQVAAMVCGFGEQAAYETLVRRIAKANLDKTSRFTDWSRRPLTGAQLDYALADVTHLRVIYEHLSARLGSTGRGGWVADELAVLADPATYRTDPDEAWLRIRTRSGGPRFLATVRELAKFREAYAQARNIPRTRVIKDDALLEVASLKPATLDDLSRARLLLREARRGEVAEGLIAAVRIAQALPPETLPRGEDPDRDTAQV